MARNGFACRRQLPEIIPKKRQKRANVCRSRWIYQIGQLLGSYPNQQCAFGGLFQKLRRRKMKEERLSLSFGTVCLIGWDEVCPFLRKYLPNCQSSIWVEIEFTGLEKWTEHSAEKLTEQVTAWPSATASVFDRKVIVTIPADFRNEFHVPDNRAERALVSWVIKGLSELAAVRVSDAQLVDLLTAIFPNNEARCFHVLRNRKPRSNDWRNRSAIAGFYR